MVPSPRRVLTRTGYNPVQLDHSEDGLLRLALHGRLVAEELSTKTRERLFTHLHWLGWTVHEMAEHTRTTDYTVGRILGRLELAPNAPRAEAAIA